MFDKDGITRRGLITSTAGAGIVAMTGAIQAAEQDDGQRKIQISGDDPDSGIYGAVQVANGLDFEVKSYLVKVNFDQNAAKIPSAFTIIFLSEKDGKGGGFFWTNRTPEAITAIAAQLDKAFAAGKQVFYNNSRKQLSIGEGTWPINGV